MANRENEIIERINEDLRLQGKDAEKANPKDLDDKWSFLISKEPSRFINKDLTVKVDALKNFRRLQIFISDAPGFDTRQPNLVNYLAGGRRGSVKLLKECLAAIRQNGHEELLRKYPSNKVGNPYLFERDGNIFTYRWTKHIRSLGLLNDILKERLKKPFSTIDIGSSYGIFSYLMKNEFPDSHCLLLDFPEQLILAHYYLGVSFPEARIAGYREIADLGKIDRNFLNEYDFVLVPWFFYKRIPADSIDLVTNFASLGEMKREWFDYYLKSEPFLSAKYFFTVNRFQSAPTYDTDLTVLDYPLQDFRKLHFSVSPIFSHTYSRRRLFFYEKIAFSSQYFEFIGERV